MSRLCFITIDLYRWPSYLQRART